MNSRAKENIVLLIIIFAVTFTGLNYLLGNASISYQDFFSYLIKKGFNAHVNIIHPLFLADRPLYSYYYLIVLVSFFCAAVLRWIPQGSLFKTRSLHSLLVSISLWMLVVTVGLQSVIFINFYLTEYQFLAGRSLAERQQSISYAEVYRFARSAGVLLKGRSRTEWITDMDLTTDPGMYIKNLMAFHIYPVDIRDIRKEPIDSLILYGKKNALESVPDDFDVIKQLDDETLIAVKKPLGP